MSQPDNGRLKKTATAFFSLVVMVPACVAQFPMSNIQLLSQLPISALGGSRGNDIWGWTDPLTGNEYAIFGRQNGSAFIDVTDPINPIYLGNLPSQTSASTWRDIKVFNDHAFIVSDGNGPHGMQIFDLTQLRGVSTPQVFTGVPNFDGFREAHNIAINEDSGFAYIVGGEQAAGGLFILDINNPLAPVVAGSFSADGYTHDVQVVNYHGPDADHAGREIAFASNVDTLTLVDVTNKSSPFQISRTGYPESGYTHQGWLSEDHRYFFLDDESDERNIPGLNNSRTHLWDVADLDAPQYLGFYEGVATGVDHNLYVKGDYIYQANDASGLRVLRYADEPVLTLEEVAFLDTFPENDNEVFEGAWSVYPFFDSGTIIVSDRSRGLFVARLDIAQPDFTDDGQLDCEDIDWLAAEIVAGTNDPAFDLSGDGQVDLVDRDLWLAEAGATNLPSGNPYLVGDANLDGLVDGADFVTWNNHKFTTSSAWCQGDFTTDGVIDGQDFVAWNANKFQDATEDALVPEPAASSMLAVIGLVVCCARRCYGNAFHKIALQNCQAYVSY